MAHEIKVKVIRSLSEIEEVRSFWISWQIHPNSDIDFYFTVVRSRPEILRPHIVVLYRDERPEAMLIARLENSRVDLKIGYAGFFRPQARVLTFIYGGLVGDPSPDDCEALAQEVMKSLRHGEADAAFFNHVRADSPLYGSLMRLSAFWGRDYFPALQTHRSMTVPGSAEEFWARLSPKVRKNQRWQAKKLLSDHPGQVRLHCFRDASELERMIQDVEQVAKKTYQRGLGVGFIDNQDMRKRLYLKAEKGWLRAYVLYVSNSPCAFWLGTLYCQEFYSDFMGYDPDYSKYSPGMYLINQVIESFCNANEEIAAIDFGLGDAQYKEILGDVQWQDASAYIFAPTLRGLGLNAVRTPIIAIDRAGRRALGRMKLLPKIKKLWRRRAAPKSRRQGFGGLEPIGQPARREQQGRVPVSAE